MDFSALRKSMVMTQLIPRGIKDKRVLEVMARVPRDIFVDGPLKNAAYDDMALPTSDGQTISQPYMVAIMTELLELKGGEKVLEIGTGSGYQAAILAELSAEVFTVERFPDLADRAAARLHSLGYNNVFVKTGDGSLGWPEKAPFDRIIVTAGSPGIPEPLIEQLDSIGIIVVPVGERYSQQLLKIRKTADGLNKEFHTPCVFVPLVGRFGW